MATAHVGLSQSFELGTEELGDGATCVHSKCPWDPHSDESILKLYIKSELPSNATNTMLSIIDDI